MMARIGIISALLLIGIASTALASDAATGEVAYTLFESEATSADAIATISYESVCPHCGGKRCGARPCHECPIPFLGITQDRMGNFVDAALPDSNLPFPVLESLVEGTGMTLPPPLGISAVFTELNRTVAVSDVRLALGADTPTSVNRISVPTSKFHASSQIARCDLWVLPFINIYGLVGYTKTSGSVDVVVSDFPTMASPDASINVPVELEGPTAGYGITTGIGGKHWFATLDFNQTWTSFDNLDSSLTALVLTPRIGMPIDHPCFKGEIHVGAMYQDTAQTVELTINHPVLGNGLHVQVDQFEPRPWNFLIGGLWAIDEQMQVMLEIGSGGRNYVITGVTLRF